MTRLRALLSVIAVIAVAMLAIPSAGAKVIEKEHYAFTISHIEQEEHGDEFCPNVPFLVLFEHEGRGMFLVKSKGSEPFPYLADRFQVHDVYTNLENGKTLTQDTVSRFSDQRIVDNGDGTITITVKGTGRIQVYGPDGERLFLDSGQVRFDILIDYNGTPEDPGDDIFLAEFEPHKLTGRGDTDDRDFCEDLVTFLG